MKRCLLAILVVASGCYAPRYRYHPEGRRYEFLGPEIWVHEDFPDGSRPGGPALPGEAYRGLFEEDELRDDCPGEIPGA